MSDPRQWTNEQYHADREYLSHSKLEYFIQSPLLYKRWRDGEWTRPESAALRLGQAVHCAVLEPAMFNHRYGLAEVTTRNTKKYKELVAEQPELTFLLMSEWETVHAMARSVTSHGEWAGLSQGAEFETAQLGEIEGVPFKCRRDIYRSDIRIIGDIKTTRNIGQSAWEKDAALFGYHRQSGCYILLHENEDPSIARTPFVHVVVSNTEPYETAFRYLDDESIMIGINEVRSYVREFAQCVDSGKWESRHKSGYRVCSLPGWYKNRGM